MFTKIKQVVSTEWKDLSNPILLCVLKVSVLDLEDKLEIKFEKTLEDGLGETYNSYIKVNNSYFLLKGAGDKESNELGVLIYIRSIESDPRMSLEYFCEALELELDSLEDVREDLNSPCWGVYVTDKENKKVEIAKFLDEESALAFTKHEEVLGNCRKHFIEFNRK